MKTMEKQFNTQSVLENELSQLLFWIQSTESRIALVLPVSMAMLGVLAVLVPVSSKWTVLSGIFVSFAVFFLVLSVIFAALSSFPRTSGPKGSLIYFSGINSRELHQYKSEMKELNEEQYTDDLINQCYRNAQIAKRKYSWIQRSIACLFFSTLPWAIAVFLLYCARS